MLYSDNKVTIDLSRIVGLSFNGKDSTMLNIIIDEGAVFQIKYDTIGDAITAYNAIKANLTGTANKE